MNETNQPPPMHPTRHVLAKFDYDTRHMSLTRDGEQVELSFKKGDRLILYGDMNDDGFYFGELNGVRGLVPSTFLTDEIPSHLIPSDSQSYTRAIQGNH